MTRWAFAVVQLTLGILVGFLAASITYAGADHLGAGTWQQDVVTVETEPGIDIVETVRPWNTLAGRRMLRPVPSGVRADIMFSPSAGASWVDWRHDGGVMRSCRIRYGVDRPVYVMQHEMGHCLGFHDHIKVPDVHGRTGLRQCNDPNAPNYSSYRGVMAYCNQRSAAYRGWRWFGPADEAMFRRAYR